MNNWYYFTLKEKILYILAILGTCSLLLFLIYVRIQFINYYIDRRIEKTLIEEELN